MQTPNRETSVFSTSALDLFASALGAFILLVMVLFPYYNHGGSDDQEVDFSELMGNKRESEAQLRKQSAEVKSMQDELTNLEGEFRAAKSRVDELKAKLEDEQSAIADEGEKKGIDDRPSGVADGVNFSILGLSTQAKNFLVVVDMSSSMNAYRSIVKKALYEILSPLTDDNRFAILGYQDSGGRSLSRFPSTSRLARGDAAEIKAARNYVDSMVARFGGSTPTNYAMQQALQYDVDAIILISDGEPTDGEWQDIVRDVSSINRRERIEINTVAIGDYTEQKVLTEFLHELAKRNGGDFVGISR